MNRKIIIATVVITGAGVLNAWTAKKPITTVVVGSYVFILVLSIMDMFGGPLSSLAGGLAMLATVYVLLTEVPWKTIIDTVQGKSGAKGASGSFGPQGASGSFGPHGASGSF